MRVESTCAGVLCYYAPDQDLPRAYLYRDKSDRLIAECYEPCDYTRRSTGSIEYYIIGVHVSRYFDTWSAGHSWLLEVLK